MNENNLTRPQNVGVNSLELSQMVHEASALSWGAIIAGAVGAAALSLILLVLGTGLGLSSVSPWSGHGLKAATFGVSTVIWISFTQFAASGMGGYLSGRLRNRFTQTPVDEVYFRDTAHGFLAWSLATLLTAALLTSAIGSILSETTQAGAVAASGLSNQTAAAVPALMNSGKSNKPEGGNAGQDYLIDALLRKDAAVKTGAGLNVSSALNSGTEESGKNSAQLARIFENALTSGSLPAEDTRYLGEVVAQRTGLAQVDAEKKVVEVFNRMQVKAKELEVAARDAADKARKASAYASLWLFISLLIGAFVASLAATYGGRQRQSY